MWGDFWLRGGKNNMGAYTPDHILLRNDMKPSEKLLYGVIVVNTNEEAMCELTNEELSRKIGLSPQQISRYISNWVKKRIVVRELNRDDRKMVTGRKLKVWIRDIQFDTDRPTIKNDDTYNQKRQRTILNINNKTISKQLTINPEIEQLTVNDKSKPLPIYQELTEDEIYQIALAKQVDYDDVVDIITKIREQYEAGGLKREVKNLKATIRVWITKAIRWGDIEQLDSNGLHILKSEHSPEGRAMWARAEEEARKRGMM